MKLKVMVKLKVMSLERVCSSSSHPAQDYGLNRIRKYLDLGLCWARASPMSWAHRLAIVAIGNFFAILRTPSPSANGETQGPTCNPSVVSRVSSHRIGFPIAYLMQLLFTEMVRDDALLTQFIITQNLCPCKFLANPVCYCRTTNYNYKKLSNIQFSL